ncbi:MAG: hypothetical protein D6776_06225 [Planctomycetota bacterium]|nr:MAG: hypothetical protein D6776_06225 [Planctomycetota bacterium]
MRRWRRIAIAALLLGGTLGAGCATSPEGRRAGGDALARVRFTLVHVRDVRIAGPEDEGLERLADAVGAITTVDELDAVLLGPGLFAAPSSWQRTLEATLSVLSIVPAPVRPLFDPAELGDAQHREAALRAFEARHMLPRRALSYGVDLGEGARLVVLGDEADGGRAVLESELRDSAAPVVVLAAREEPTAEPLRRLIARERRIQCVLCAEPRPEGRPDDWPPVLVAPSLAETERLRIVQVGAGAILSWTRPVFEGPAGRRLQRLLRRSEESHP